MTRRDSSVPSRPLRIELSLFRVLLAGFGALLLCALAAAHAADSGAYRIIVKLRASDGSIRRLGAERALRSTNSAMLALASRTHLTLRASRSIAANLQVLELAPGGGESLSSVLRRLNADARVEYAEEDQRSFALAIPNDPLFQGSAGGQWYLQNASATPAAVDAVDAWGLTTGNTGLVIADLDTGVRFDHEDLGRADGVGSGRLLPGYTFFSGQNALVYANTGDTNQSDASDPGDWVSSTDVQQYSACSGQSTTNSSWHGLRTAGIIGAASNNGIGVAGLTWQGWVLPVRVLGKCGGYDSDIQTGMLWAAGIAVVGVPANPYPARILNLSLGAKRSCLTSYQDVIDELSSIGVLVVAAAGNDGGPVQSPANCIGVAAIGGLRHDGTKVGYSDLGHQVAISAPAGNCVSTTGLCQYAINTTDNLGLTTPQANSYSDQTDTSLGTSFSAPIVSGITGLMLSVNGNLSPAQLIARLQEGATPFPVSTDPSVAQCFDPPSGNYTQTTQCNCTTATCGAGMANAYGAVQAALRPIAAISPPSPVASPVTLDGSGSGAACARTLASYAWSIVSGVGSLSGDTTPSATLTLGDSNPVVVQLLVTDDHGLSDSAQITVTASSASTTAPASAGTTACLTSITPVLPVTVTVTPSGPSVQTGVGTQQFSAVVTSNSNTAVSWYVNDVAGGNATVGTVDANGLYHAPVALPSNAVVDVKAIAAADTTASGVAGVTLTAAVAVSLTPDSAQVNVGATQSFDVSLSNAGSNTGVIWYVNNVAGGDTTVGTISANGVYTAPAVVPSPATVTVSAVAAADPTQSASAQVTVSAGKSGGGGGALDGLTLAMLAALLAARRTQRSDSGRS